MVMRQPLHRLFLLVVLGTLATTLSATSPANAGQPVQSAATEATTTDIPVHEPIIGVWQGVVFGVKVIFEVHRTPEGKFRAISSTPEPGCEYFLVSGRGRYYKGIAGANCDGSGTGFNVLVTLNTRLDKMRLGPPPGEPGDPFYFYRVR
jgi:hypothetical protein